MTGNDLHSRLVSSLTARLDRARAAAAFEWLNVGIAVESTPSVPAPFAASQDIVVYLQDRDPRDEIRRVEATLRVVQRHRPEVVTYAGGRENTECHEDGETYPCQDIADIATGEGIEP